MEGNMASRRGHGDGSIYERMVGGKLQYVGQISLGRVDGKRVRRAVHGATKAEVRAKLKEVQRNADAGLTTAGPQTVGEWLTKWLSQLEAGQKKRYATVKRYSSLARVHLIPGLGHHRLDKLSRVHVDDFLAAKLGELEPRTVHHLRAVLRTALNRALRDGLMLRNAAALTDPVEVPKKPKRSLSVDEARALLLAAQSERLEALYVLDLNLGLRIGEALALRWQDVNLNAGRLSVVYNLQRVRGKLVLVEPKTDESRRTISLPPAVVQALLNHRARQREERLRHLPLWQDSDLIFTSQIGSPLDPSDVSRGFQEFLVRKGLPKVRFHDLRRSAATIMAKQHVLPHDLKRILGHSKIATTMEIYVDSGDEALDEAAVKMGLALG
jgi:integrase